MDFSTISNTGVIAIAVLGVFILSGIAMVSKMLKTRNMTVKVGDKEFGIGNNNTQTCATVPDNIMHKKRVVAEAHMEVIAIALEEMTAKKVVNYKSSPIAQLLFELLNKELENMILKHIMDNHIGETTDELNLYVDIKSREYAAAIISFYKRIYHSIPEELKSIRDVGTYDRLEAFFKKELMRLFKDIKSLDKLL